MSHGRGTEVWDVDGNRFLDFAAGIAVCSTGHSHPAVVQAIKDAADKFLHISRDYWHEGQVRLGERIERAVADEGAGHELLLPVRHRERRRRAEARALHDAARPRFIGFLGGFHGRTMGSLSFTSSKYTQQQGFFPTMPGVTHVPYPNPYRPLFAGADQGEAVLRLHRGRAVRAHRAGGAKSPRSSSSRSRARAGISCRRDGFLAGLRALCDQHGILLIFDEVQSGIGRTGKMFAAQHWDVAPDIMTLAKGLGPDCPSAWWSPSARIMRKWKRGAHGNTFGGNPVCCAAALATIDLVQSGLMANAASVRRLLHGEAARAAARHPVIGEMRGKGLMIGMELVNDRASKAPAKELCDGSSSAPTTTACCCCPAARARSGSCRRCR